MAKATSAWVRPDRALMRASASASIAITGSVPAGFLGIRFPVARI
jgi:hypothetical protein